MLSFDLHDGTSMERAKEVAQIINNNYSVFGDYDLKGG